ncbi:MAG: glycoside hydrolase family 27 protein [Lachnospiraceae bacterium]|nr:glycoside hydrolase family 27 protein [Lachnospiraceae bacterium]
MIPAPLKGEKFRFDAFKNGEVLYNKKKGRLPAMGWNSWNAFGSGNTEALTKAMADKIVELGLDKLGYSYCVLDDGCYKPEREDGKLVNEPKKFPSGFKALADYIHAQGLKFGMYNDIGTNLCAGAAVGTYMHEAVDAKSYIEWGVDFIKVDNCYYMFDNATFSNPENARFTYAPNIKGIKLVSKVGADQNKALTINLSATDGRLKGAGIKAAEDENGTKYVTNIGTFDGTNTGTTPVGDMSGELCFNINEGIPDSWECEEYDLFIEYATGREPGTGEWLQIAVDNEDGSKLIYDDFLEASDGKETFRWSKPIPVRLKKGKNVIRLMNHRRQENTLNSYAELLKGFNEAAPDNDIILSICEWGKTQPQNWGYKVGDSWRILNDITFRVGWDGNPGIGRWYDPGTPSVTSQYNKAVVMDEFAGLDKGWNDPDMLMIGMDGLTDIQCKTHMVMWCMMNSPLMLGLDLRRVKKGDWIYEIIANKGLIALNQDALGIQAKRLSTSVETADPAKDYITDNDRVDILVKPLSDGGAAISFINVSERKQTGDFKISASDIPFASFIKGDKYKVTDLWTGEESETKDGVFRVSELAACDCYTIKIKAC